MQRDPEPFKETLFASAQDISSVHHPKARENHLEKSVNQERLKQGGRGRVSADSSTERPRGEGRIIERHARREVKSGFAQCVI